MRNKDFALSYKQKAWNSAAAEYARLQCWLVAPNPKMREYATERIHSLVQKWPQLLK